MPVTLRITFSNGRSAPAVHVAAGNELPTALQEIGLEPPRRVLVLVGGAGKLPEDTAARLHPFFDSVLVPLAADEGVAVIDGGTDAGIMRLMGLARRRNPAFDLIGVAAAGTVILPGTAPSSRNAALLEPNHSHFVLVPGDTWGAEVPWISRVATTLAADLPSVTVLINGGEIAWQDVQASLQAGRRVLVVSGSGRTADVLVAACGGELGDVRAVELLSSGLLGVLDPSEGTLAMRHALCQALELAPREA